MKNKKKIFLTVIILIILVGILGVWKFKDDYTRTIKK